MHPGKASSPLPHRCRRRERRIGVRRGTRRRAPVCTALAGAVFAGLGGAAAGASLVAAHGSGDATGTSALAQTFLDALHGALFVSAAVAAIGVMTALARGREGVATN